MKKPTHNEILKMIRPAVNIEQDSDGFWANCPAGWGCADEPGCHVFYGESMVRIAQQITSYLAPCDCLSCERNLEKQAMEKAINDRLI